MERQICNAVRSLSKLGNKLRERKRYLAQEYCREVNSAYSPNNIVIVHGGQGMSSTSTIWVGTREVPTVTRLIRTTLNTDGCLRKESNIAGGGGILLDRWFLGHCSVMEAEMWARIFDLRLAWERGSRFLKVEIHSFLTFEWATQHSPGAGEHKHINLISELKELLLGSWSVEIQHIYRERNQSWQVYP